MVCDTMKWLLCFKLIDCVAHYIQQWIPTKHLPVLNFQADKQALQEELERKLSEKDKEIAELNLENKVRQP